MSKHVEKAMSLRSVVPAKDINCCQAVMRAFCEDTGITEQQAIDIGRCFGGGMRCGATCGAVTGGLMVLGLNGIEDPAVIKEYREMFSKGYNGLTDCRDLLKMNAEANGDKKAFCDGIIRDSIEAVEKTLEKHTH